MILELAKLTIEITPPIRPKNHDNVALVAPHYKVPNRLRWGVFCISKECHWEGNVAPKEHGPSMSEALRSIFSPIVMKRRRRRRCSGSTSRRKYTFDFQALAGYI